MRRAGRLVTVCAAAIVLVGCAVAADPTWTPDHWAPASVRVTTAPAPLDPPPALSGMRVRNDAVGVQARVALAPGGAALNERVLTIVREGVAGRAQAAGVAFAPEAHPRGEGMGDRMCAAGSTLRPAAELLADPALGAPGGAGTAVVCDVVVAAGSLLGERIRTVTGDAGGISADASVVLYSDLATGEVATAAELWLPDAAAALWEALVDAVRRDAGALSLAPVAPPDQAALAGLQAALTTAVPAADGSLVVTLPPGFTAPELTALGVEAEEQARVVGVPPAVSTGLLAPLGSAVVAAVAQGLPFTPPEGGVPVADCRLVPCVAVTYDDGPGSSTAGILDAYAQRHASATFFVLGQKAAGAKDLLARMVAEGHEVGNHTWNHPHLPLLTPEAVGRQIRDTSAVIAAATGRPVTMFRPPYGEYSGAVLAEAGLPAILWDVDTSDYLGPGDDELIARAVDRARAGSIVLQHDIHAVTARTVGAVIDGLHDRGFSLVTVSQLFGGTAPLSGAWRSAR
ncbi:polysaccharide deacetylase family protein [Microbacterium sp. RD1]|uniref:polysaccharide deacetylase family protein n=1 Tax=Microbacterium sp. RD1 TaxID=3457313 RepID=UPI003FA5FAC8